MMVRALREQVRDTQADQCNDEVREQSWNRSVVLWVMMGLVSVVWERLVRAVMGLTPASDTE